jgi:peptide/nickel transport system substrate-binding protein
MKRFIILLVILAFSVSMAFAAGEEEGTTMATTGPQYGGTLTVFGPSQDGDFASPDIMDGSWPPRGLMFIEEHLLEGNFQKYGPRGSGAYPFTAVAYIPSDYLEGNLITSWDITPKKTTWHVRKGVQWQDVPHVMGGRDLELTADDIVADLIYFSKTPAGSQSWAPMFNDVYSTDKYTVVIETPGFNIDLMYIVGYEDRATYCPPEVYAAPGGGSKWENRVGTGPYIFEEYVVGSHMSFTKNPNWWRKTTTIDGVEYDIPFIDKMIKPIMPDEATRLAALRTANLDFHYEVDAAAWDILDKTKGIVPNKFDAGMGYRWALNVQNEPLDNIAVRRALFRATNIDGFGKMVYAGLDLDVPLHWFPMYSKDPSATTPMNELPADIKELYDYNPEAAKKMLADAGYPNGFTLEVNTDSSAAVQAMTSLLADQWSEIGVELDIESYASADQHVYGFERNYTHLCYDDIETANAILTVRQAGETGHFLNITTSEDAYVDAEMKKIMGEIDDGKRNAMLKDLGVYVLGQVYSVPMSAKLMANYWWPWIQNYYGEVSIGDVADFEMVLSMAWIDQGMKKEMGY